MTGEPTLHCSFLKKTDICICGEKNFRNKYTKVLGGTISGDVVMITLFSSFFSQILHRSVSVLSFLLDIKV